MLISFSATKLRDFPSILMPSFPFILMSLSARIVRFSYSLLTICWIRIHMNHIIYKLWSKLMANLAIQGALKGGLMLLMSPLARADMWCCFFISLTNVAVINSNILKYSKGNFPRSLSTLFVVYVTAPFFDIRMSDTCQLKEISMPPLFETMLHITRTTS